MEEKNVEIICSKVVASLFNIGFLNLNKKKVDYDLLEEKLNNYFEEFQIEDDNVRFELTRKIVIYLNSLGFIIENLEEEKEKIIDEYDDEIDNDFHSRFYHDKAYADDVKLYLADIGTIPLLKPEEEYELAVLCKNGDAEAKSKLISANLRLVVSIAKRFVNRGLPFLDLIQEGNMGLMKAADKFEPSRGYKFSTYATWWIRQSVTRSLADKSRLVRIPVHATESINKLLAAERKIYQTTGSVATYQDLAEELEWTLEKVEMVKKSNMEFISLETPIGEDGDTLLMDFLADEESDVEDDVMYESLKDDVATTLETLSDREKTVLNLRFGINSGHPMTLEEVGKILGVTRERVRQIESKALKKLRHPSRSRVLKPYTTR